MNLFRCALQPFSWLLGRASRQSDRGSSPVPILQPSESETVDSANRGLWERSTPSPPRITIDTCDIDFHSHISLCETSSGTSSAGPLSSRHHWNGTIHSKDIDPIEPYLRNRSPSVSSVSPMAQHLKEEIENSRIESSYDRREKFIPRDKLGKLINEPEISDILEDEGMDRKAAKKVAVQICGRAKNIFAILVLLKKPKAIQYFLEEGISDADLPLWRPPKDKDYLLQRKKDGSRELVQCMKHWKSRHREKFDINQRLLTAPVFKYREHLDLEDCVLPFVADDNAPEVKEGAYSKVFARRIHNAHHKLPLKLDEQNNYPLVAIKTLKTSEEKEFRKEYDALKRIHHPHLIKLLATFRHKSEWNFVFQYADSNLRTYWEACPNPNFQEVVYWSLKQMVGVASGLAHVHDFRPTFPQNLPMIHETAKPKEITRLQVEESEKPFGRHGDIKPENILFFKCMDGVDDENGILQIADFGLGRFHGRDSRSNVDPSGIAFSPTYEPPECKISKPVSRVYDIWSLGCLYLEWITWLLEGNEQIEKFSEHRGETSLLGIDDDSFFTILPTRDQAKVRDGVNTWVDRLHSHPKCSELIHELLDLIMDEMIVVDSGQRIRSFLLCGVLNQKLLKSEHDKTYLLQPSHRPRKFPESKAKPFARSPLNPQQRTKTVSWDLHRNATNAL